MDTSTEALVTTHGPRTNELTLPSTSEADPRQTWEDKQLQIMGNLRLLQFLRTVLPTPPHPPIWTDNKTLRTLSWIACSFVREEQGDCVAAALTTSAGEVKLYLAANRGNPQEKDMENTNAFLATLREAMREYKDTRSVAKASLLLARHAISTSTERLARKLKAISTTATEAPWDSQTGDAANLEKKADTFESLLKKWYELPDAPKEDPKLAKFFRIAFPDVQGLPPNEMLLHLFRELVELCETGSDQLRACAHAELVAKSKFFDSLSDSESTPPFFGTDRVWLLKLKRRIWRVARYSADAVLVVKKAFDMFTKILGDHLEDFLKGGSEISVEWVGDHDKTPPSGHGALHLWPSSSRERLQEFLTAHTPNISLPEDNVFLSALDGVFHANDCVYPKFHCEARLIYYLQRNNICVVDNAVGVSKLPCFACNAYVDTVNASLGPGRWKLPGCSNKYHHAWLIPPNGALVVDVVERRMKDVLEELARENVLLRARANSAGSDNSGGEWSDGEDSDDAAFELFRRLVTHP